MEEGQKEQEKEEKSKTIDDKALSELLALLSSKDSRDHEEVLCK